jgi:Peptidase family M28
MRTTGTLIRRLAGSLTRIAVGAVGAIVLIWVALVVVFTAPTVSTIRSVLPSNASSTNLRKHVEYLCTGSPARRSDNEDALNAVAGYVEQQFQASGGRVSLQEYPARGHSYRNIVASFGPEIGPALVIGAHYDVFGELPGADDNASGVAGLMELGRLLGQTPPIVRIDLVAFSTEEPPFFGSTEMGSGVHARALRAAGRPILGMISVEMIGFYSERQPWNNVLLDLLFPTTGDFVMVVGRWKDATLTRFVKRAMRGASDVPVVGLTAPQLPGIDASDHLSFWRNGYLAVMVTDTAYMRNANYHTNDDRPDTLDFETMARVVDGLYGVATNAGHLRLP